MTWSLLWRRVMGAMGPLTAIALLFALPALGDVGPVSNISSACAGNNAEVEQAVDPTLGYVYEEWMGCKGIAVARSQDGGYLGCAGQPARHWWLERAHLGSCYSRRA